MHSKIKSFICNVCGLKFSTKGNLLQHTSKHSPAPDQRRVTCDICDKTFSRPSHLKDHLNTHTKARAYQCEPCGKKFSSSSSLSKHKKLHGGMFFSCPVPSCVKKFTQNSHLQKHLGSIHLDVNFCKICNITFKRAHNFNAHLTTHKQNHPKTIILSDEIIAAAQKS